MNHRRMGRTNLMVSELGFGACGISGNARGASYGPTDDAESSRAIHAALAIAPFAVHYQTLASSRSRGGAGS